MPTTTQHITTTTHASTTTTTHASTTTTTIGLSYGGQWYFSGTLSSDTCGGVDYYLNANVYVTHAPNSSSVSVNIGTAPTMYGTADAAGFDAGETHYSDGCYVTGAIVALRTSNPSIMDAGIGIDIDCGIGGSCRAIWTGDLTR